MCPPSCRFCTIFVLNVGFSDVSVKRGDTVGATGAVREQSSGGVRCGEASDRGGLRHSVAAPGRQPLRSLREPADRQSDSGTSIYPLRARECELACRPLRLPQHSAADHFSRCQRPPNQSWGLFLARGIDCPRFYLLLNHQYGCLVSRIIDICTISIFFLQVFLKVEPKYREVLR